MKSLSRIVLLTLVVIACNVTEVQAAGPLGRLFGNGRSTTTRVQTQSSNVPGSYPTRNLNQGRTVLPAGRSYYQGRYYGNFNNRFYGPQYGYF